MKLFGDLEKVLPVLTGNETKLYIYLLDGIMHHNDIAPDGETPNPPLRVGPEDYHKATGLNYKKSTKALKGLASKGLVTFENGRLVLHYAGFDWDGCDER